MTTTVYLPRASVGPSGEATHLKAEDVFNALDAAGVKWVLESLEEFKVRMMQTQIKELQHVLQEMNEANAALTMSARQYKLENEQLKSELQACREANDTQGDWIQRLQDEQGQLKAKNHFLKGGKGKEIPE